MLNRRQFILSTGAAIGCMAMGVKAKGAENPSPASAKRPNILYLLADQWRGSATGYAGDPNIKTPSLDRLATQAVNFRNAVSVCPVCTPYRASLLTGRYPTSTGMFINDAELPASELCMAQILKQAGYATAYIGKWHLDGHGPQAYIPPERRHGWDYWKAAEVDHNYTHSHYYSGNSPDMKYWEGYDAFAQTKDAQQYLRDHARSDQPFALVVSFGPPHFPLNKAPQKYSDIYANQAMQLPPNVGEDFREKAQAALKEYYANCTAVDTCVGDLLATLDEAGLAQNTIVVFTSDHGDMMGAHGCPPKMKQAAWDEAARVPFLLRYPQVTGSAGKTIAMPLTTPDILPTLLGLAGVAIPGSVEGEDLAPIVSGKRQAMDRAALYMSVAPGGWSAKYMRPYRAIRTSQYTYVRSPEGPWLLFDDVKDPGQMNNLVEKPEMAALRKELDGRLQAILKKNGDDFLSGPESLAAWGYSPDAGYRVPYVPGSPVASPHRQSAK